MTEEQSKRKSLLGERFDGRKGKTKRSQLGRPKSDKNRKSVSFWLEPEVLEELDKAYHQFNLDLSGVVSLDKATFRELVIRKGLSYVSDIREEVRRNREED